MVGANLFPAKIKDEIAIALARRAKFEKLEMVDAATVSVGDCRPHSHYAGVEQRVALAQSETISQMGATTLVEAY